MIRSWASDCTEITEVLLADGWHKVIARSFDIVDWSDEFSFRCSDGHFMGPLTSIVAVKIKRARE